MLLHVINDPKGAPEDYEERKTAKAVVVGADGKVLMFRSSLLGGGVEEGETFEDALHREVLEETGAVVEVLKPLGGIIGYHDNAKKKYVVEGYLCKYIDTLSTPTTPHEYEQRITAVWQDPAESIVRLEKELQNLEREDPSDYDPGVHQSKMHTRQIAVILLKEFLKK